ncbi:hypothetical protein PVK06_030422 [Gossypium arboreum]|uniref:Uncharacterized protein n=1 Tax=Gossypium arboreum TaxID=29729 RepID=A0ABR0NN88_GOSAR|nr:hypothetical protein PVK06_030422 [Gossypium arboreum]
MTFLLCCVNSTCLCKFDRVRLELYDCLNDCLITSSLFNLSGTLEIKKLLLHVESSAQTYVFKLGVYHYGSTLKEIEPYKFCKVKCECDVYFIDDWHLAKKMKLVHSGYNFKLIPMLSIMPIMGIHFEKVRPIYTLEFGNGLFAQVWIENSERVCKFFHNVLSSCLYHVDDIVKWLIPKEGGYETNLSSFQVVCDIEVIIKCDNQGPCVDERFVTSKWPDLRTSRFEEEGMMRARPRTHQARARIR